MRVILIFSFFINAYIFGQNTYFVDVNGNNNNSGSILNPFKTIFKASQVAQPGDFVYVRGGVYRNTDFNDGDIWNGSSAGRIICNGTASQYITFQPYLNEEVIFEFDANYGIQISNSSYVIFKGFKVKGIGENITYAEAQANWGLYKLPDGSIHDITGNESLMPLPSGTTKPSYYNGRGLVANSCHHVKLINNTIYNCPSSGIRGEQSDYIEIIGNIVYNNTYWTTQGVGAITIAEATNIDNINDVKFKIEQNLVYENENKLISWNPSKSFITYVIDEGSGIFLTRNKDTYLYGKIKISNNIVYKSGASGIMSHFTDRAIITFNTLYYNGASNDGFPGGIGINNTDGVIIANNIVYARPTKWAIGTTAQPNTNYSVESNIVYNENSSQSVYNNISSGWVNVNPQFINETASDFNLQPISPAINSSSINHSENFDFYNNFRIDVINDIGAIEYTSSLNNQDFSNIEIQIFPNPSTNQITILSNQNIKILGIYNLIGQELRNWKIESETNYEIKLDISNFESNVYFIKTSLGSKLFLKNN
jgi:hypothetical protein